MKWSTGMAVAMWVGLVSLVIGIVVKLGNFPSYPLNLYPRSYINFTIACFLFAIVAGLFHIIRTKGK